MVWKTLDYFDKFQLMLYISVNIICPPQALVLKDWTPSAGLFRGDWIVLAVIS